MQHPSVTTLGLPASRRVDWLGYRHALVRSSYALLIVLVMLLPANFVAYALVTGLFHGNAFAGLQIALLHHRAGFWLASGSHATAVGGAVWWLAACTQGLFWASCASAVMLFLLWLGRAAVARLRPGMPARRPPRRPLGRARAA